MSPRFNQLWQSVALSNFTDGSMKIFLPFIALTIAIRPSEVAYVFTFLTLGWPLFGWLSGVIIDRLRMASMPFWCHAIRAILFAWLAIEAARNDITLWHLYVAAFIFSLFDVGFEVSLPKLVLETTTDANRVRSNTRLAVTHTVTSEFLGPVLGAILSLYDPVLGLSLIAVFYTISGFMLSRLFRARQANAMAQKAEETTPKTPILTALLEPIFWLFGNRTLLLLAIVGLSSTLGWGAWLSLEPYYLIKTMPATISKLQFGFLMSVLACGAVIAALIFEKFSIDKNNLLLLFFNEAGVIGILAISALTKTPYLIALGLFFAGAGATIWSSIVITMRQEVVPHHILGGVNGFFRVIVYGGLPIGSYIAGTLAETLPIPVIFAILAAIIAGAASLILMAHRAHQVSTSINKGSFP